MSNLLQKASIITTPTAYDSGKILSVKPVQTYGPELVNSWTNKDFSSFASNGSNITQMVSSGSGNNCYSSVSFTSGKTYELKFTSSQSITAQIRISLNINLTSAQVVLSNPTSGSNSIIFTPTSNYVYIGFYAPGSFTDTQISAFSLREKTDADFDFTRNSLATRVGSNGLIQTVASNIPRIDYTGGVGSWKFEPQRTNLVTQSNNLTLGWSGFAFGGGNMSLNYGFLSPDGSNNATRLTYTNTSAGSGGALLTSNITLVANTVYTISFYAKHVSGTKQIRVDLRNSASAGVIGSSFTLTNQWKKYSHTVTNDNATARGVQIRIIDSEFAGNRVFDMWGVQLEQSSFATSIIPTSGSAVTRLQDVATGSGSSGLISSTEGTLYAEIDIKSISSGTFLCLSDGSSSNRVIFGFSSGSGSFFITGSGSTSSSQFSITTEQFNKIALTYKANERKVFVNGSSVYSSTSAFSMPTGLNELSFDSNGIGSQDFQGSAKSVAVFKEALTDLELECLVSWMSFSDLGINFGYTVE